MKIYILPVSGGGFAVQLGLLKAIYQSTRGENTPGITPDIVLSSSGGNVAAYVSMIGNWDNNMIEKNTHIVDSSLFVESWTPSFFPTWIAFPLTKSLYRSGDGVRQLFKKVFTPRSIVTTEIWSGTYNTSTQKACFFCNKAIENSLIKDKGEDTYIYDAEKSVYLDGDREKISKVCYASASIPYITPGVLIDKERHIDGGVAYASPLIPMSSRLSNLINSKGPGELIQIHYFSSYNMNQVFSDSLYSSSIGLLIHSSLLQDRAFSLNFLKQYGGVSPVPEIYHDVNHIRLRPIMKYLEDKSYVIMFSPKISKSVQITSFEGKDVLKVIKETDSDFTVYVWKLLYRK